MKTNYSAVLVCAVVYWLMGGIWYDLLFQKRWLSLEHLTPADASRMSPVWPYVITLILNLLIAFVLAQICAWRNANTASRGAAVGTLLWIGFVGPIAYTTNMYELRPPELFALNYFYPLAGLVVMGAILGAWRRTAA